MTSVFWRTSYCLRRQRIFFDKYQVWKNDSGSQTETSAQMLIMAGAHVASKAFAGISFIIARFVFEASPHFLHPLSLSITIGKTFQPFSVQTNPQDPNTKQKIFKIKNTIGKTLPPIVQTSKRLALGCNGFSQQDVQHGRGIVQKKMSFYLKLEI